MAWTINTFAGQRANGPDSNWRVAMFELCRAVNERDACVNAGGSGKTLFYKADGTEGSDLTYADFLGMSIGGSPNLVKLNLKRIQTRIKALAAFATESSGYSDLLGVSGLETAIGSTFLAEPTKATHAAYWQQLKDALDVLVNFRRGASLGAATKAYIYSQYDPFFGGPPQHNSLESAWDNMNQSGTSHSFFIGCDASARRETGSSDVKYLTRAYYSAAFDVTFPAYTGTITALAYDASVALTEGNVFSGSNSTTCTLDTPFTINVGGNTETAPDTDGTHVLFGDPGDITFGGTETITWSYTVPSDCPISNPGSGLAENNDWYHRYNIGPGSTINAYFNISAELTDQA